MLSPDCLTAPTATCRKLSRLTSDSRRRIPSRSVTSRKCWRAATVAAEAGRAELGEQPPGGLAGQVGHVLTIRGDVLAAQLEPLDEHAAEHDGVEQARQAGRGAADGGHHGEGPPDVDAERPHHVAVPDAGPDDDAVPGPAQEPGSAPSTAMPVPRATKDPFGIRSGPIAVTAVSQPGTATGRELLPNPPSSSPTSARSSPMVTRIWLTGLPRAGG
jgi:hypothetical protein